MKQNSKLKLQEMTSISEQLKMLLCWHEESPEESPKEPRANPFLSLVIFILIRLHSYKWKYLFSIASSIQNQSSLPSLTGVEMVSVIFSYCFMSLQPHE